jgi:hypothetical protein
MDNKRIAIVIILTLCLLAGGCAQSTAHVKQDEDTYGTSMHMIFQPDYADRSFSISKDYMLSTEFNDVTYIWPEGKGNFSRKLKGISFEGKSISCSVVGRILTINESQIAEFEQGDRVRITGDGRVFVNGAELKSTVDI